MRIVVKSSRYYDWVPATAENPAEHWEDIRLMHPQHPTAMLVKRLHDSPNKTVLEVPDERVKQMATDLAVNKYKVDPPQRKHLNEIMEHHVVEIVHRHHCPVEHWTDIECDDKKLEKHLRTALLPSEDL